jgi:DNA/RNA endonuclease G (NUC1)
LVDWKDIPTFTDPNGYLSKLGIDPTATTYQPNYAIELDSAHNTITHNRFLVPDWGALRFDLFTGAINNATSSSSNTPAQLNVFFDALDGSNPTLIDYVKLERAVETADEYQEDTHRIGYGERGFETFTVNIPNAWRGKVGTLRFQIVNSNQNVYLDNVFFNSQHLLLGNPTEARATGNSVSNSFYNNYLIEKPQFAVSYSGDSYIPNWSAWEVNKSWTGSERPDEFFRDPSLNSLGFVSAKESDYARPLSNIIPGPNQPNGDPYKLAPGHLSPNADRGRNLKDAISTFSTSNILPQHGTHNNSIWKSLEAFERNLATQQSREVYIYAGGVGEKDPTQDKANIVINNDPDYGSYSLQVPATLWKVFLILDHPGLGIQDITITNAQAFAVWTNNTLPQRSGSGYTRWNEGGMEIITISELENRLNADANNAARGIRYDFFSNIASPVRQTLKTTPINVPSGTTPYTAFLIAETSQLDGNSNILGTNVSIGHDGIVEYRIDNIGIISNLGATQITSSKVDSNHTSEIEIGTDKSGIGQIGVIQSSMSKFSSTQISSLEINPIQIGLPKMSISQIGITKIDSIQNHFSQDRPTQINTSQIGTDQLIGGFNFDSTEISLPSIITLQQLLSSHNPNLQNTTVPSWISYLNSTAPFNLKIEIQDLPTGQLAEGTITGYDTNGRPNSGTLTLDTDGNSLGWFIDTTPDDNTEFTTQLADTAYKATADSAASGKYDLLTTILHELGHLNGIIRGNTAFDTHVQNIKGIPTFIDGGITAQLTPDGSHLDSTLYPYDLMNTSLKPGVRKLPSSLDLSILNTLWSNKPTTSQQLSTTANLTAGALIGITNGDFTTPTTWNTAGATNIINGTATLTEQSQKLSELTQAFIIPTGAKTLQFTIKDNHLIPGDTTLTANDAFVGEAFALAISRSPRHQHPQTPSWNQHRTQPHRLSPQHPSQRHHLQEQQSNHHHPQQQQHRKYRSHPDRPHYPSHPLLQPFRIRCQNQHHHH